MKGSSEWFFEVSTSLDRVGSSCGRDYVRS
jgi:hypothetical protein